MRCPIRGDGMVDVNQVRIATLVRLPDNLMRESHGLIRPNCKLSARIAPNLRWWRCDFFDHPALVVVAKDEVQSQFAASLRIRGQTTMKHHVTVGQADRVNISPLIRA